MSVKQVFNTSAELDYPTVLPTLDLDFANSKTLDPRITFTRASGGSYVGADGLIKYAGVNEARFDHDPVTGESLGLLVEEARTNLLLRSEEFNDAGWTKEQSSILQNDALAPNGAQTADKLVENTATGTHTVYQGISGLADSTSYTVTVYAKSAGRTAFVLGFMDKTLVTRGANFDLASGTVSTDAVVGATAYSISAAGDGWYRCSVTQSSATGAATPRHFILLYNGTNISYTGDGTSGIYLWGAQLEQGSFPTSYIPTIGSTRTRAADDASITGKNFSDFYNQSEWTLMIAARRNYAGNFLGFPNLARINHGTNDNTIGFYGALGSTQFTNFPVVSGGVSQTEYELINIPTTSQFKMIQALKFNDSTFGGDGILRTTDSTVLMPVGVNQMLIGGDGKWGGTISQISYYPKALPPSQLQALTS